MFPSLSRLNAVNVWRYRGFGVEVESIIEMALCNKLGSLARQSISQNGQVSMASMLNSCRCIPSKYLFVRGSDE